MKIAFYITIILGAILFQFGIIFPWIFSNTLLPLSVDIILFLTIFMLDVASIIMGTMMIIKLLNKYEIKL